MWKDHDTALCEEHSLHQFMAKIAVSGASICQHQHVTLT